jgi:hypothetical protein
MNEITKLDGYVITGKWDIQASFKPHKESKISKVVTLRFNLDKVPLKDIITSSLRDKRIDTVNGKLRKNFDTYKDKQVVEVDYTSPATNIMSEQERIDLLVVNFRKAGLPESEARKLAEKAIKNPDILQ